MAQSGLASRRATGSWGGQDALWCAEVVVVWAAPGSLSTKLTCRAAGHASDISAAGERARQNGTMPPVARTSRGRRK